MFFPISRSTVRIRTNNLSETWRFDVARIDKLDESRVPTEKLDFSRVDVLPAGDAADCGENFLGIFTSLSFVQVLKLDVDIRLRLHVG
jgi:hypothetical protein